MSKLSYKTLLIIFLSLLIAIVVLWKFVLPKQQIKAAWWNETWMYRQYFPITNTSGSDQINFVIKININTSSLISLNKMQNSCNDIRVIDINGDLLQHFTTQCNTSNTNLYIKIPITLSSGTGVYIYYGSSTAPNIETSSIFTYFESFDTGTTTIPWSTTQISVGVTNNLVNKGNYSLRFTAQGAAWDSLFQNFPTSNNWTDNYLEYEFYSDIAGSAPIWYTDPRDSSNNRMNPWKTTSISGGSWITFSQDLNTNTYKNDIKSIQYFTGNDNDNRQVYLDNFRIRKCTSAVYSDTPQSEELSPAPVAYWKFDEGVGTTAYDSSSNNLNGNITGATWQNEDQCVSGKCLYFNGVGSGNKVDLGNSIKLDPSVFTISSWVKPDDASLSYGYIYSNDRDCCEVLNGFSLSINSGKLYGRIWNSTGVAISSNSNISSNKWTYVTFTYDGTNMKLYIDGKLDKTQSYTGGVGSPASRNSSIGTMGHNQGYYTFKGYLDEFKLYPYARTAAQIKLDYNSRGSKKGSSVNLGVKSNTNPPLSSKLIAYYKFDENNGTTAYDSSINKTNGVLQSSPTWSNNGKVNKSLNFTAASDSRVRAPITTTNGLNIKGAITYSAWFKRTTTTGYQTLIDMLDSCNSTGDGYFLRFETGGILRFYAAIDNAVGSAPFTLSYTNSILNDTSNWHQVITTWDGTTNTNGAKMYIDGKLVAQTTAGVDATLMASLTGANLTIGSLNCNTHSFDGLIDEVKIYNTALTDDEIKQDYNQGSAISFGSTNQTIGGTTTSLEYCIPGDTSFCASPVAEWNFEENTGTVAKDSSGNNNNGTITGAIWTVGKKNTGAGLNFNSSNNYISMSTSSPELNTNDFTISVWAYFGDSTYQWQRLVGKKAIAGTAAGYSIYYGGDTGKLMWSTADGSTGNEYWTTQTFTKNTWHHIVMVRNSSDARVGYFYVDGKRYEITNIPSILNVSSPTQNFSVGAINNGTLQFKGYLDQVKIYNYARTPAQIAYDYNKGAPVGWWKLDECQGLTAFDASGFGNNGTINIGSAGSQTSAGTCQVGTSAAWTNGASGKINSSLNFDGTDDKISISSITNFPYYQNPRSISIWAKLSTSPSHYNTLLAYGTAGTGQANGLTISTSSKVTFFGYGSQDLSSNTTLAINKWYHIVATYNGTNTKIYINGSFDNSSTATWNTTPGIFYIGEQINNANEYFNGQIDDVRIYNYALTSEQIKQIYNGGAVNFN